MSAPQHDWSPKDSGSKLRIENSEESGAAAAAPLLSPFDAERLVEQLRTFSLEEVGTSQYLQQHLDLVQLNHQAHQSAAAKSDEFVIEAILTFDKMPVIVHELLLIEAWKQFVYPKVCEQLASENGMRMYFVLYHEATLVNLLEMLLYHRHIVGYSSDLIVELVDYCSRKLNLLIANSYRNATPQVQPLSVSDVKDMAQRSPLEDLESHKTDIEFRAAVASVSMLRYICEHSDATNLAVVSRITDTHDLLLSVCPLIENPPWTRRLKDGRWQKLINLVWTDVQPADLMTVTQLEGQMWLTLYHLICKKELRENYHFHSFRKSTLLRVRKYLNEVMLDQLPVLADVQRFMDELAIVDMPPPTSFGSSLMMQQVATVRDSLVRDKNWDAVAERSRAVFGEFNDRTDPDLRRVVELYTQDSFEGLV